ncbi:integrase core domain-containing protein [Hirsutella rhossiliensis]
MLLEPDYGTPLECRDDYGSLTRCLSETCKIHKHAKIGEWHNATRSKASEPSIFTRLAQRIRCDEEDYNECAHLNCKVHEHEKARAWHKRHNGAPKDYWRHLRRLQATFDQGKLTQKNYAQNRKTQNENSIPAQCKQHSVEKQEIFDWLQEISLLSPDTTPRDENIKKRYQQQIEEEYPNETNKDQAKRGTPSVKGLQTGTTRQDPRTLCMATASHGNQMVLDIQIAGHHVHALLDCGAMGNYVSPRVINRYRLPWRHKKDPYELTNIEGEAFNYNNGIIDMEIDHLDINIQGHDERVDFDIMDIGEHDLVLGLPWLQESNPLINWKTGQLRWNEDATTEQDERDDRSSKSLRASAIQTKTATEPADTTKSTDKTHVLTNTAVQPGIRHKQNKGHNKKIRRVIATLRKDLEQINKELESRETSSQKKEQSPQDRMKNIPQEYRKYDKLFKEELETGLPEHSQWDHEICLKDGRTPTFHKIYNLNEKQLQTLRDYLDENLRKGYIRTSTSEAGYPVIRLNDITMKDRTPLPLISELRDRLHGKKWFTALDLKGAYNLIRMKKGHEWMTAFRTKFGLFEYLDVQKRQIELETDASDFALGAQIGQKDDEGRLRPIAFYSKKLHGAELNYPIYDKEFLAIIQAFKEFRHYLLGSKHKIKIRWAECLSEFDYEIIHRKGTENGRADALSRRSDYDTGAPIVKGQLLELNNEGNMQQRQLNAIFKVNPDEGLTKKIQQAYDKVDWEPLPVVWEDGLAKHQGKIFVPEELQDEVIREIHEHPTHGHQGIRRTMERIRRIYDFPRMKKRISETIRKCELCARSKAERHKPYGELQPLPVPKKPWDSIAFDHITKLPPSKEPMTNVKYDSIFVITDRLTKYGYFLPYKEASNAEELAYVFLRTIVSNHGLPNEIVSDRGSTFVAKFWQALMAQLGTKHKLSTAYHPQTDGQTERLNQTLEQYLRCYISYEQNDWVKWLPTAQLAYNSSVTETTKLSPAYANYGYNPEAFKVTRQGPQAERAILQADQLRKLHKEMQQELQFVRERMSTHYNRKRLQGPIFQEGDMVYLVRRNIKTKRPSNKLDFKKLGPFKVKKTISKVNYELSLPTTMRIHPIFHISLLEPAPRNAKPQEKSKSTTIKNTKQNKYWTQENKVSNRNTL